MKSIIKYPMLFLFGGSIYYLLEIIFRGYSFPAMVACGGLCFIICGAINEKNRCMPLVLQQLVAAAGITAIEFLFGLVLNVLLGLHMWDYSNMPGNILGQICPQFTVLWFEPQHCKLRAYLTENVSRHVAIIPHMQTEQHVQNQSE